MQKFIRKTKILQQKISRQTTKARFGRLRRPAWKRNRKLYYTAAGAHTNVSRQVPNISHCTTATRLSYDDAFVTDLLRSLTVKL